MFKLRREQMEAFRPLVRAQIPHRILTDLQKQGARAERDPATGDIVATDPRGYRTRLSFQSDGLPARLTQPSGATCRFEHDKQDRLAVLTYPGGERVEMERDARGNVCEFRRPGLLSYYLEHDENDCLLAARYPDGSTTRLTYHPEGSLDSITDRMGATTRYNRDPDGRLRSIIDPLGRETIYETDKDGCLEAVVFPDGTRQEYAFDSTARVAAVRQRDGGVILQELDEKNRVKSITWSDGSRTEFEFDEADNLTVARNDVGEIVHTFDAEGNPLTETTRFGTVSYEYDPAGRLTRLVTPFGNSIEYEYDEDGRLAVARDWQERENRFVYAQDGTVAEIHYGNGLIEKQRYARVGRLQSSAVVTGLGHVISEQIYEYDLNERLTSYADFWGEAPSQRSMRRFEYDAESRLTLEIDAESRKVFASYEYDAKGNLIRDNGAPVEVGALDNPQRYGSSFIEYDANGNMIRLPGAKGEIRCHFSADGTIRQLSVEGRTFLYEYDALGRRSLKTDQKAIWRYGWAGDQLLWEEYQEGVNAPRRRRDYLVVPGRNTPFSFCDGDTTFWLQSDASSFTIRAFDDHGRVAWRALYDSFGSVQASEGRIEQPWRLLGQYEDIESGLHYNFARYYSPRLKVYLSSDPNYHHPESTSFSYARNDPWNRVDPLGAIAPLLVIVGGIALRAAIGAAVGAVAGAAAAWVLDKDPWTGAKYGALVGAGIGGAWPLIARGLGVIGTALIPLFKRGAEVCVQCGVKARAALAGVGAFIARFGRRMLKWAKGWFKKKKPRTKPKHDGWRKQFEKKTTKEIEKSIRSLEKQIAEHKDKIKNPSKHIKDWDKLDPRQRRALLEEKWPSDIRRQKEQMEILKDILRKGRLP